MVGAEVVAGDGHQLGVLGADRSLGSGLARGGLAAEQHQDTRTAERLRLVLQKTLEILRESAPPQIRFINQLMSVESDDDAQALIESQAAQFGPELLELMEAIAQDLDENSQSDEAKRLRAMRDLASVYVAASPSSM